MRPGHRKLWRAVAESAAKVAASKNFAEEYVYGIEFTNGLDALLKAGCEGPSGDISLASTTAALPPPESAVSSSSPEKRLS